MVERERFEEFCHSNNILIYYVDDLSTRIRGFCHYDGEYYNVLLNNKLCSNQIKKTTVHEIIHILENHFDCSPNYLEQCESEVDYLINEFKLSWGV